MIYSEFKGLQISQLGFGAMRLPVTNGHVDEEHVAHMVDWAMANGVNYFDTAYPYHGGDSERVLGRVLAGYPRESYYLATKYPGHQIASTYDPAAVFEEQLEKCGVDYFDFYLLHNVNDTCVDTYFDSRWGIIDYFIRQKQNGRIRHLGFSTHGSLEFMEDFLKKMGSHMEFCQIQLNYLDWTLQDAKAKCELLNRYNVPVWVMEPLRGGKLAKLPEESAARLQALRPDEPVPAWAFRFLQGMENVKVILSGMSELDQMKANVQTFETSAPLNEEETRALLEVAETLKDSVPCTACRYCCDGCPKGLDIPMLLAAYNDYRFYASFNVSMRIDALEEDKHPASCIECGQCTQICPQKIDVPAALKDFIERMKKNPSWAQVCKEREEAARKKP